jgi:hypothetical protein
MPCGVRHGPSPIFRARKASLVQTGCPSMPVVLDCTPPVPFGLSPPFRRKTLFAFRVRGIHQEDRPQAMAPVVRRGILHRQPVTLSAWHAACLCRNRSSIEFGRSGFGQPVANVDAVSGRKLPELVCTAEAMATCSALVRNQEQLERARALPQQRRARRAHLLDAMLPISVFLPCHNVDDMCHVS